jgi:hypothetical protein
MWTYAQRTGALSRDGEYEGTGYSGTGEGRNNPSLQCEPDIGPIPQGVYRIGPAYDHPHLGPCVMTLEPAAGTNTFGRSLFRIHGDNVRHDASHGCIVFGPGTRRLISASGDRGLTVTP